MHKKRSTNQNLTYDINIVEALKKLPVPLKTFDGHYVYFDVDKRKETIFEHIANKKHHLHKVDILRIPEILRTKVALHNDKNGQKYRTYIGNRGKTNEKNKYLKIVTNVKKNNAESVVTICAIK